MNKKLETDDDYINFIVRQFPQLYVPKNICNPSSLKLNQNQLRHLINKLLETIPDKIRESASEENPLGVAIQAGSWIDNDGRFFMATLNIHINQEETLGYGVKIDRKSKSTAAIGKILTMEKMLVELDLAEESVMEDEAESSSGLDEEIEALRLTLSHREANETKRFLTERVRPVRQKKKRRPEEEEREEKQAAEEPEKSEESADSSDSAEKQRSLCRLM